MIFETLLILFGLAISLWCYIDNFHTNRPPGPFRLPVVGTLIQLGIDKSKPMHEIFRSLSKKYGPVSSFQLGPYPGVILDDFDTIKKVLNNELFVGRFWNEIFAERSFKKHLGIIFVSGESWKEMRRFTMKTLKDFGYGKQMSMESVLEDEVKDLITMVDKRREENNSIVDMKQLFTLPVLNVLWSMVCSTRSAEDDEKIKTLLDLVDKLSRATPMAKGVLTPFPFLRHLFPDLTGFTYIQRINHQLQEYFREVLNKRRQEGHYKTDQRDYIDVFLKEIDHHKEINSSPNFYTDEQFIITTIDLFEAGAETTSNTLEFGIYYIMMNPSCQVKVQEEIDRVIGRNTRPTIADKAKMIYTEATLMEIQRMSNVLPMTARSSPSEDFWVDGYKISKGTLTFMNIYSTHMDEGFWGDPENFRPERFLNENGEIIASKSQRVLPFGAGRRVCIGETLARATLFIYFTTLLQNFKFEKSSNSSTGKPVELGFTLTPAPYSCKVLKR